MKISSTQIERRFEISSSLAGLIDGSFEIGNLLVIVFVSYFGSKLHRPKLIGIGCFLMGTGSILMALPHFFMGYYRYSKETSIDPSESSTSNLSNCLINQMLTLNRTPPEIIERGCVKESGSHMWIYVFMGNMLRGIGETPIVPLGISYIDDFAKEGHSSLYLGTVNAMGMTGLVFAFMLGSLFATMYVDIGYVDLIVQPELKALAIGFHSMIMRLLGGILVPIYFGAVIDTTCMKWSTNSCGARGACRIYNSTVLGRAFFGLKVALLFPVLVLLTVFIFVVKKKFHGKDTKVSENERRVMDEANLEFLNNSEHFVPSAEEQ
uniref:Solute carrier organic anion transporter family member n=1 Tax=Nomascus leucogenys TaxID=61853 RepID=A0A2I3HFH7_NOMLE